MRKSNKAASAVSASYSPTSKSKTSSKLGYNGDKHYSRFLRLLQANFESSLERGGGILFQTTSSEDLFEVYLNAFPASQRQHYTCHCCREFIRKYGGLVVVDADGVQHSALWHHSIASATDQLAAVEALQRAVDQSVIDSVFYTTESVWGFPTSGGWDHLAIRPDSKLVFRHRVDSAFQAAAKKRESYRILTEAFATITPQVVAQAIALLEADALYRSDEVIGPARFLQECFQLKGTKQQKANKLWKMVARSSEGVCRPRGSMIGTLLEDLESHNQGRMSMEAVQSRFAEKMSPISYMRPQAAPSAGTLKRAEEIASKMNLAPALERRYALIRDMRLEWSPKSPRAEQSGPVFGHLAPKQSTRSESHLSLVRRAATGPALTGRRFMTEVLPSAESVFVRLKTTNYPIVSFVTATDPDAIPLLKWDLPEDRNPVSWYLIHGGSQPAMHGLSNDWVRATGVTKMSNQWTLPQVEEKRAVILLEGAKPIRNRRCLGLFPESLRAELHEVRSVIEAHQTSVSASNWEEADAVGVQIGTTPIEICVVKQGIAVKHFIDRWE